MIGAAGVGKTSYWLYPCLEYALASGMSFLSTDTKGDVVRNYGRIAQECYGYRVGVIDLRNPTRSDGFNLLHLVNKYMDLFKEKPGNLLFKAKAERYAKIISKTIITAGMDGQNFGRTSFSMTPPRACSPPPSCWWRSSALHRSGTLCQCSKSSRS